MRTFRINGFTKNCKTDMAKKTATLYFSEAVGFMVKAFGIDCHYKTHTRVEDDGELECLVTIEGNSNEEEEAAIRLFEELLIERTDRFSSVPDEED